MAGENVKNTKEEWAMISNPLLLGYPRDWLSFTPR
jgi:hypothetical protein